MDLIAKLRQAATAQFHEDISLSVEDYTEAADEIERLRALLRRCLVSVEGGKWRDRAGLSAEAHPVWDDVRETLCDHEQQGPRED